jgi:hypothetical protein
VELLVIQRELNNAHKHTYIIFIVPSYGTCQTDSQDFIKKQVIEYCQEMINLWLGGQDQ